MSEKKKAITASIFLGFLLVLLGYLYANEGSKSNKPILANKGYISKFVYIRHQETGLCFLWAYVTDNKGNALTTHSGSFGMARIPCQKIPDKVKK